MAGRQHLPAIIISVTVTVLFATSAPFWYHPLLRGIGVEDHKPERVPGVIALEGGCAPFQVFAQNRFEPYGAAIRTAPNVLTSQIGAKDPNQSISADGWVHGQVAYPTNSPPWNSDVWFHLADGAGWVSFAGVRATVTVPDPEGGFGDGGPPVDLDGTCQGSAQ